MSEKGKHTPLCVDDLRHAEYYQMQSIFDELYAKSQRGEVLDDLMSIIISREIFFWHIATSRRIPAVIPQERTTSLSKTSEGYRLRRSLKKFVSSSKAANTVTDLSLYDAKTSQNPTAPPDRSAYRASGTVWYSNVSSK